MLGADGALPLDQQLMRLVAMQPQGAVLLPAMPDYSAVERAQLAASSRHPHGQLMAFLHRPRGHKMAIAPLASGGCSRCDPPNWLPSYPRLAVNSWCNGGLRRPTVAATNRMPPASAPIASPENFSVQPCHNQHQEAQLIALAMRRALDNSRENPITKPP
jgi:hypothetical protein